MSKKSKKREADLREQQERELLLAQEKLDREAAERQQEEDRKTRRSVAMEEYYNIAYAKERKRLNELFGRIDYGYVPEEPTVVERVVYKDPDLSAYVPVEKYKKKKRIAGFFIATTVIFGVAAIVLALNTFVLHLF